MHVSKSSGGSPVGQPQGRCNAVDRNRAGAQRNPQIATLELQRRQVSHFTKHRCFVGSAPLAACCSQRRTRLSAGACIGFKCAQAIRRACRRDERDRSRGAFAPESCINRLPSRSKRAQGRPGAGRTHGPPANKKAGGSHHRLGRDTRPSLRDGFNGVLRALPGDRAFLPPSRADRSAHLASASGCQDHTTFPSALGSFVRAPIARCDPTRPSHPAPYVRDDREAPL